MIRILSLGAGVQSTAVLLMSIKGELPKLDHAIFADTGWESRETYEHLKRIKEYAERHDLPVHIVKAEGEDIRAYESTANRNRSCMPTFAVGENGRGVPKLRKCTSDYKVVPIERFIKRQILEIPVGVRSPKTPVVEQWYGISVDEAQRMRHSQDGWKVNAYPLCGWPEEMLPKPYSRQDCVEWLKQNWSYPVPRSACLGCPFHSDAEWRKIKQNPEYWKDVTEFDRAIRHSGGMRGEVFLHRSLKPLEEVDFSTAEDHGQLNLFNNECTGHCGV